MIWQNLVLLVCAQHRLISTMWLSSVFVSGIPAAAQLLQLPTKPSQCSVDAWVSSAFDSPAVVYDAPSETAVVLGYLPNGNNNPDEERYSIEFRVTQARPGWLRIRDAKVREGSDVNGRGTTPSVYLGEGWIHSHMAQVGVQSSFGYLRPDTQSPRVLDLKGKWLTEAGWINGIQGCSGEWLLLDFAIEDGGKAGASSAAGRRAPVSTGTAWFRGVCSVQDANCDMRPMDGRP